MKSTTKKLITLSSVAGGLLLVLCVLLVARGLSPTFADWVTLNITQWWVYAIGHFSSLFPISIFELFVVCVIFCVILIIILLIRLIVKRNFFIFINTLLIVCIAGLSLGNLYTLTAGFAYYRSPITVNQSSKHYTNDMVTDVATYFLNDYNYLANKLPRDGNGNVIMPYTIKELSKIIGEEYQKLNYDYLFDYTPTGKGLANSWFLTLNNITGITFVPLGEPTINLQMPPSDLPHTLAHEIAHSKGVMREGDCNFIAYYILVNSSNEYLRYCGYFSSFSSILSAVNAGQTKTTEYISIKDNLSPLIVAEQKNAYSFWINKSSRKDFIGALNRFFEKIGSFVNDIYLKLNGAQNGGNSYTDNSSDGGIIDTGKIDPDTDLPVYEIVYTSMQKMYFYIYEVSSA